MVSAPRKWGRASSDSPSSSMSAWPVKEEREARRARNSPRDLVPSCVAPRGQIQYHIHTITNTTSPSEVHTTLILAYPFTPSSKTLQAPPTPDMASPPLHVDDLSFSDLDLITTPPAGAASSSNKHARPTTRPSFKPAAAGPRPSASQSQQANLRLLQGVNKPPPMAAANRAAGGGNKRRTSLFVPSALPKANSSAADEADESAAVEQGEGEGDDSLLEAMKSAKPREPALPTLPASFHQQRPTRGANAAADEEAEGAGGEGESETKEQVQRQLDDLSKMNSSFEAYERMLQGTVGQIDVSARGKRSHLFPSSLIPLLISSFLSSLATASKQRPRSSPRISTSCGAPLATKACS